MRTTPRRLAGVLTMVAFCTAGGARGALHAQQAGAAPALMVGVAGTADVGGAFQGTAFLTRFDANDNGLVAVGTIDGVLSGRSIVTKIAMPVTIAPSSALQTTAGATSCAVHVNLEPSAFRALGSTVTLARSGFDIAAQPTQASDTAAISFSPLTLPTTASSLALPASSGIGTPGAFPITAPPAVGSAVPTAPVGSAVPGVISPAPQPANPSVATSMQQLGQLVCSVSTLSQSSTSTAQLAGALNQVLLALHQ